MLIVADVGIGLFGSPFENLRGSDGILKLLILFALVGCGKHHRIGYHHLVVCSQGAAARNFSDADTRCTAAQGDEVAVDFVGQEVKELADLFPVQAVHEHSGICALPDEKRQVGTALRPDTPKGQRPCEQYPTQPESGAASGFGLRPFRLGDIDAYGMTGLALNVLGNQLVGMHKSAQYGRGMVSVADDRLVAAEYAPRGPRYLPKSDPPVARGRCRQLVTHVVQQAFSGECVIAARLRPENLPDHGNY